MIDYHRYADFRYNVVVRIVALLILDKPLAVFEFAYVVVVRASFGKIGAFAYRVGAQLRKIAYRNAMIECAGRSLRKLLE